jgi:hypothetical protein
VRDDLREFGRLHAVVESEIERARKLDRLVAGDKRGDRDDAAVPRRQTRPLPQIAEHDVIRIFFEGGRDSADVFGRRMVFTPSVLFAAGSAGDDRKRKQGATSNLIAPVP